MSDKILYVAFRWAQIDHSPNDYQLSIGMISACKEKVMDFLAKQKSDDWNMKEIEDGEEYPL